MSVKRLPTEVGVDRPVPRLSRQLRCDAVGGGRISGKQATAARRTDRGEAVAGTLSSEPAKAAARRVEMPDGWLGVPGVADGAEGVRFIEASVRSNAAAGARVAI